VVESYDAAIGINVAFAQMEEESFDLLGNDRHVFPVIGSVPKHSTFFTTSRLDITCDTKAAQNVKTKRAVRS
jgi:hypothetical protein